MRLLVWYWSGGGGGSQFAVDLATRLSREPDCEVALSLRADDPTQALAKIRGLCVMRANVSSSRSRPWSTVAALPRSLSTIKKQIADFRPDAVLIAMNFAAAAPLGALLGCRLVYFAHDPAPHPGDFAPTMQRLTQSVLLARADEVVALSGYGARALRGSKPSARIVPLASVYSARTAPRSPLSGPVKLLMYGRLMDYKGLALLSEALAGLSARDDWRLTVAGPGRVPAEVRQRLTRLRQVDEIRDRWLSEEEIDALIDRHNVVIAPYISATQSGVVAQAMAAAMPVIATRVGALEEQLGGTGWLAEPDPASLRAAIVRALDEAPRYADHSAAAHGAARKALRTEVFSWLHDMARG